MAVLQMQKLSICALKRDRKAILEKIQSMGIMEVSQIQEDTQGLEKMNTQTARSMFEKNAASADMALGILAVCAGEIFHVCQPGREKAG